MCDVYVTPYLNEAQMTSGTLAYSFGLGKAVVSTPYWHAGELLAEDAACWSVRRSVGDRRRHVAGLVDQTMCAGSKCVGAPMPPAER